MKALTSQLKHLTLRHRTSLSLVCRFSSGQGPSNQSKNNPKQYFNNDLKGSRKLRHGSNSGTKSSMTRSTEDYSYSTLNENSRFSREKSENGSDSSLDSDSGSDSESDSESDSDDDSVDDEGLLNKDVPSNIKRDSLIPKEVRLKVFNTKLNEEQKTRFLSFRKDVQSLSKNETPESLETRFHMYLAENPHSHFVSSQVFKKMSTVFSLAGDIERCEELLKLYPKLKRDQGGKDKKQANLHALIVNNYLLSLTCTPDTERAKQLALDFLYEAKQRPATLHPIVKRTLGNVLRTLGLFSEMEEALNSYDTSPLTPESLLDTVQQKLETGDGEHAQVLLEQHLSDIRSSRVDLDITVDHYALLAKVASSIYDSPAYRQIGQFCRVPKASLKNFSHFPSPLLKNSTLCKNYELVLHIAREKENIKLFRIVGGRNGLCRQLEHVNSHEYIVMVQYIAQLCHYHNIGLDVPFWNYLLTTFFYVSQRPCDYDDFRTLYAAIRIYPLTSTLWCRVIGNVKLVQLPVVFRDLVQVGLMDDDIYTALITRTQGSEVLSRELEQLSGFYSVVSDPQQARTNVKKGGSKTV